MPSVPATLGINTQPHRNVRSPLPQAAVAEDHDENADGAEPQWNAQQHEDCPDHDVTPVTRESGAAAVTSLIPVKGPYRCCPGPASPRMDERVLVSGRRWRVDA